MSARPQAVQFSFLANSTTPEDQSGTARWVIPVWYRGQWDTETIDVDFLTFMDAHRMNNILAAIWKAGDCRAGRDGGSRAQVGVVSDDHR